MCVTHVKDQRPKCLQRTFVLYCKLPLTKVSTSCLECKNKKLGPHLVLFSTQLRLHVHQARAWPYLVFLVVNGGSKPHWLPHLASVDVAKWGGHIFVLKQHQFPCFQNIHRFGFWKRSPWEICQMADVMPCCLVMARSVILEYCFWSCILAKYFVSLICITWQLYIQL